jgi:hypothetical protein
LKEQVLAQKFRCVVFIVLIRDWIATLHAQQRL